MPYATSVERLAKQEERIEGQVEMLLHALEQRYQRSVPDELAVRIRGTTEAAILQQWLGLMFSVSSLEEFQQRMQS